jgi:PAS domain S-box-containing protein
MGIDLGKSRRYLQLGSAIILTSGLSAVVSGIAIWGILHHSSPAIASYEAQVRPSVFFVQAISSLVMWGIAIAALRAAIAEHRRSAVRFRTFAETAACAILVYQDTRFKYVNSAVEAITGYSRRELMSMDFWEVVHPDHRDIVRERGLARQQGESVPTRYEIKLLTKFGEERWVDFNAGIICLEGKPAGLATAYDITDRKHAESRLAMSAERERLLAQIASRIRASLNLEEILNVTVAEIRAFLQVDRVFIDYFTESGSSRVVAESVSPDYPSVLGWQIDRHEMEDICAMLEPGQVRVVNDTSQFDSITLKRCCEEFQVKSSIGVPISLNGHVFGILVINQCAAPRHWQPFEVDLAQKLGTQVEIAIQQSQLYQQVQILAADLERQVEERTLELKQRMEELQHLNEVKDVLLHAVSHDLRTPVQGTLMVLNGLRTKCCNDAVTLPKTVINCMIASSDRQLALLDSLMENHADKPALLTLNREPVNFKALLQDTLNQCAPLLERNQTAIDDRVSTNVMVHADATKLRQVLEQLLTNAVKHNPPQQIITLTAETVQSNTTPALCVTIADTGVGISPDQCDRLFKLYVRGLRNQHLTGIGLGLYHCHQIITSHGGQIGVNSELGLGSRFWFTIPLADEYKIENDHH